MLHIFFVDIYFTQVMARCLLTAQPHRDTWRAARVAFWETSLECVRIPAQVGSGGVARIGGNAAGGIWPGIRRSSGLVLSHREIFPLASAVLQMPSVRKWNWDSNRDRDWYCPETEDDTNTQTKIMVKKREEYQINDYAPQYMYSCI